MGRCGVAYRVDTPGFTRWVLCATPLGTLAIDRCVSPDRGWHRHSATFVSLVIRGGYVEHRAGDPDQGPVARPRVFGDITIVRSEVPHRVDGLLNGPVWTITIIPSAERAS